MFFKNNSLRETLLKKYPRGKNYVIQIIIRSRLICYIEYIYETRLPRSLRSEIVQGVLRRRDIG